MDKVVSRTRMPEEASEAGVVYPKRSPLAMLARLVRDPLSAIPPEAYTERMAVTHAFGLTRAYLSDPVLIHEALVRNAAGLSKSHEMKRVLGAALGDGLLTADGPTWRWQRQTVAPAFQHDRLAALLPAMIVAAEATRDRWLALPAGTVVDLGHEMMMTTFEIILETMLSGQDEMDAAGVERGVTDFLSATAWMFVLAIVKAPTWLPFPGRRRAREGTRFMRNTLKERIAARRLDDEARQDDLIARLIAARDPETGRAMTDEEITDNILTFIGAGHETTAIALGWTFALLAQNPDCATRLVAEVDAVIGDRPVRPEHVAELVYARQVVSETMRLYPPAPLIARAVDREIEIAGVTFPEKSVLFVPIHAVHRHAALWPEPERFDPDRFSVEASRGRHRFAYMPFGAGPRVCIGNGFAMMEAVAILAVLVKALRLELTGDIPGAQMAVTLRPTSPLRMRVVAR